MFLLWRVTAHIDQKQLEQMSGSPPATDDGSRVSTHFINPTLKLSLPTQFERSLVVGGSLDKKGKETALAYLQALTNSRSRFLSKVDSSAADTDAELDEAASSYLSQLLGLVNNYAATNTATELDQETGQAALQLERSALFESAAPGLNYSQN